jgi:outer membrane protein assembly factor BamB
MACFGSAAFASEWPEWRGPKRNGISTEKVRLSWPSGGPEVLWRASVGTGFSSMSIQKDRLYTMGNATNQDTVWCFNSLGGEVLWKCTYPSQLGPQYYPGGPGSTPTVAGDRVFTISKWGEVFCLDAASGKVMWQRDLRQEGFKPNRWGFAGSPLVWHDLVIFNAGSSGVALARNTGRVVWSTGTNPTGYASPTLMRLQGHEVLLIFAAKHLVALEPASGRELWRYPWETGWDTNNTDPLPYDHRVLLSSFTHGCALLALNGGGPHPLYQSNVLSNHLSPGILLGHHLYAFNGEAKQDTDFRCIDLLTGQLKWSRKDPAFGSLICADSKLIILSEKGELILAEGSPEAFKPLARAKVLNGLCWIPPALAQGRLYVRNAQGDLACLDLRPTR